MAIALALAFALALPPVAAAPYLQTSVDPARTGASADAGPAWDDVAFVARVPGSRVGPPLLFDGAAYVLTRDFGGRGLSTEGLFAVDLASAEVRTLASFDVHPLGMASDGRDVYV
ncbi:MAG: hypothetical protein ACT4PT_10520, partial [Methanobacteriota archaeon]